MSYQSTSSMRVSGGGNKTNVDTSGIERRLDRVAATSALASRANQEAIEGLRGEMVAVSRKLSRVVRKERTR